MDDMAHDSPPAPDPELARAALAARMFYVDGRTKSDIAGELRLSRFKVARLLDLAREAGLVRIQVTSPAGLDVDLADAVRRRFGLAEVCVLDLPASSADDERAQLGHAAAPLVGSFLRDGDVVGVAWGRTLSALVDELPVLNASVVQIAGGLPGSFGESPVDLARRLAGRWNGQPSLLEAPFVVAGESAAQVLRDEPANRATLRRFDELDVAITGIGAFAVPFPPPSPSGLPPALAALPEPDRVRLGDAMVVAEFCGQFVAADGTLLDVGLGNRMLCISAGQLAGTDRVVAIAGGAAKAYALQAALRTRLITHLVTDRPAARDLLSH